MSDVLLVDFGALQRASADIQGALNALRTQLDLLEDEAAALVTTWDGDARQAYQIRQARWRSAADDLSMMLREIRSALDESAAEYLSTEKKNASLFQ